MVVASSSSSTSGSSGSSTTGTSPGGSGWACPLATLPEADVSCDAGPDEAALADCSATGAAALVGGTPFPTVADAVGAALSDEVVTVCPGTWDGTFVASVPLVIQAADPTGGATVLDPSNAHFHASVTVRGLTLRNGSTLLEADAPAVLECLVVEGATRSAVVANAALTVRDSVFRDNLAQEGRTAHDGAAVQAWSGLVLEDSWFGNNRARYAGGALFVFGDATVSRSVFAGNHAEYEGGAIAWGALDPFELTIDGSHFVCNSSGYEGGAVDAGVRAADVVTVRGTTFEANHARYEGSAITLGSWGAVDFTAEDTLFVGNDGSRGALDIGGWLEDGGASVSLVRTSFTDNVARSGASAIGVNGWVQVLSFDAQELVVQRNLGGSGALDRGPGSFSCTGCDWGTGGDENLPADSTDGSLGSDFAL
jgi:hypothetical protein